ncbi:MAG: hypothetical protein U1F49_18335 [Rubrivivax sp.]
MKTWSSSACAAAAASAELLKVNCVQLSCSELHEPSLKVTS